MNMQPTVVYSCLRRSVSYRQLVGLVAVCMVVLFSLCGCTKPSYPKEELANRVKEFIANEYGYDTKVKIIGKTLGIYVSLSQILTYDMDASESFKTKRQDIFLTALRVCLSTDADIEFFVTIFSDRSRGIEYSFIQSVDDSKRLLLGTISRNDYVERSVVNPTFSMSYLSEGLVRDLLEGIPDKRSKMAQQFMPGDEFNTSFWFKYLMESELKDNIKYSVLDLKTKQLSDTSALVYVKARESYLPKEGYGQYTFMFPSGTVFEWVFEVRFMYNLTLRVVNSYSNKDILNGRVITPQMGMPFSENNDIASWDDYFYMTEITLPEFMIGQVFSKLNRKIREAEDPDAERRDDDYEELELPIHVVSISGQFIEGENEYTGAPRTFQLTYRFKEGQSELTDQVRDYSVKIFQRVLKKYKYTDYTQLLLLSSDGGLLNSFDKQSIDALQSSKFSWKSLLRPAQY